MRLQVCRTSGAGTGQPRRICPAPAAQGSGAALQQQQPHTGQASQEGSLRCAHLQCPGAGCWPSAQTPSRPFPQTARSARSPPPASCPPRGHPSSRPPAWRRTGPMLCGGAGLLGPGAGREGMPASGGGSSSTHQPGSPLPPHLVTIVEPAAFGRARGCWHKGVAAAGAFLNAGQHVGHALPHDVARKLSAAPGDVRACGCGGGGRGGGERACASRPAAGGRGTAATRAAGVGGWHACWRLERVGCAGPTQRCAGRAAGQPARRCHHQAASHQRGQGTHCWLCWCSPGGCQGLGRAAAASPPRL